jgi:uncharacterized protein YjbI with pentapeptide repeats
MANAYHLELLRQGVDVWNAWREKEPSVTPDLAEANLMVANLIKVNLSAAILVRANLRLANLSGAHL